MALRSNILLRKQFFSQRIIDLWNNLESSIVEAQSVITLFKNRLDKKWPTIGNRDYVN